MTFFKKYKLTIAFLIIALTILFINPNEGKNIFKLAANDFKTMLMTIPPIFIMIGLMDVWVKKETMIKHMGETLVLKVYFGLFY